MLHHMQIPLPEPLADALKALLAEGGPRDLIIKALDTPEADRNTLFLSSTGRAITANNVSKLWQQYILPEGAKQGGPQAARSTFVEAINGEASKGLEALRPDAAACGLIMGHDSIRMWGQAYDKNKRPREAMQAMQRTHRYMDAMAASGSRTMQQQQLSAAEGSQEQHQEQQDLETNAAAALLSLKASGSAGYCSSRPVRSATTAGAALSKPRRPTAAPLLHASAGVNKTATHVPQAAATAVASTAIRAAAAVGGGAASSAGLMSTVPVLQQLGQQLPDFSALLKGAAGSQLLSHRQQQQQQQQMQPSHEAEDQQRISPGVAEQPGVTDSRGAVGGVSTQQTGVAIERRAEVIELLSSDSDDSDDDSEGGADADSDVEIVDHQPDVIELLGSSSSDDESNDSDSVTSSSSDFGTDSMSVSVTDSGSEWVEGMSDGDSEAATSSSATSMEEEEEEEEAYSSSEDDTDMT